MQDEAGVANATGPGTDIADLPSRERLLRVAERLFAERGVDGVGLREIVRAAGHKNAGSLYYHFGNKEQLIEAIIAHGARRGEAWRRERLAELESSGEPITVRDVIKVLIGAAIGHEDTDTYVRFIQHVSLTHRHLVQRAFDAHVGDTMFRCYEHLRDLIDDVPPKLLEQRRVFLEIYLMGLMSTRNADLGRDPHGSRWATALVTENLIDTCIGLLRAPVSTECAGALAAGEENP